MRDWFRHPAAWCLPLALVALGALAAATVVIEVADDGRVTVTDPQGRVEVRPTGDRDDTPAEQSTTDGSVEDSPDVAPIAFADDTPTAWAVGAEADIAIDTPAIWPAGADALVIAWSDRQGAMVEGFAERFTAAPVRLTGEQLGALPAGGVELQALWRKGGRVVAMARHRVEITRPTEDRADAARSDAAPGAGLPRDDAGFTVWPLRPGARTVYVAAAGLNTNSGLSPDDPVRSLRRGMTLLRDREGDHLLLRAGDTFHAGFGTWSVSGRSAEHPVVIGVYGDGDRPLILTSGGGLLRTDARSRVDFVALQGLRVVAARRDPAQPGFDPDRIPWRETGVAWFASGQGLHFEDCVFERFNFHLVLQHEHLNGIRDVTVRRCVLANAYSHWNGDKGGHSSGLFATGVTGLHIDESVLDHNGWAPPEDGIHGAGRTKFNHNLYLQQRCRELSVTRSVIARGASYGLQLRPGGRVEGNLFARNTHALYLAVGPSVVAGNVVAESDDLNDRADGRRGYGIVTWPVEHALVEDNLLLHKRGHAPWAGAIEVTTFGDWSAPVPGYRVTLAGNTIVGWPVKKGDPAIVVYDRDAQITRRGNVLDRASGGPADPDFADPGMTLDRAAGGDFVAWIERARQRHRGTWEPDLSAAALNAKFFAAFTVRD